MISLNIIRVRKRNHIKLKVIISIFLIIIILITYILYLDKNITPTAMAIGELKAQEIITKAINESVSMVVKQDIKYQDLISIKEDSEGSITMIQADTFLMNRVASDVALTIQDHLKEIKAFSEGIPIGSILGSQIMAQHGPKIKLTIRPMGSVDVNFGTEFEHVGINQTRHRVYLIINTKVKAIIPFSTNTINVTTYFPVTETIIVGKIPMNYINVPEDKFLNIAPIYD